MEASGFEVCRRQVVLTVGPFAIETYEPRQVRNEAAVNEIFYVPEDTLTRANDQSNARRLIAEVGCTTKFLISMLIDIFFCLNNG